MRWDGSQDKAQQGAVVGSRARTRTERKTQDEATIRIPRSCDWNLSDCSIAIRIGSVVKLLDARFNSLLVQQVESQVQNASNKIKFSYTLQCGVVVCFST